MPKNTDLEVFGDLSPAAQQRLIEEASQILTDHHADLRGLDPMVEGREDDVVVNVVFVDEHNEPAVQLTSVWFDSSGSIKESGTQYGVLTL